MAVGEEDHPRGCGEHQGALLGTLPEWGSSPRMRGTPESEILVGKYPGIIPADAGNTGCRLWRSNPSWDHPRGCGEQFTQRQSIKQATGSSPRMRGTPAHVRARGIMLRIIPADAGNTSCSSPPRCWKQDHPRGCGEHLGVLAGLPDHGGSSPRMRGTPQ